MDLAARYVGRELLHVNMFSASAVGLRLVENRPKSGRSPSATESLFSCVAKRKVTKREGHPAWRLPPIHARQVREPGPGFSTAHPCAGEKESASCRFPLRGLSSPSHRRTGAPGRAAVHPGPHSVRIGCAAAKAEAAPLFPGPCAAALTDLAGRMLGKRQAGCSFSLSTQRESDSPSAGGRKLFALKPAKASRPKSLLQVSAVGAAS